MSEKDNRSTSCGLQNSDVEMEEKKERKRHCSQSDQAETKKMNMSETLSASKAIKKLTAEVSEIKANLTQVLLDKNHQKILFEEELRALKIENFQLRQQLDNANTQNDNPIISNSQDTPYVPNGIDDKKKKKKIQDTQTNKTKTQELWPNLPAISPNLPTTSNGAAMSTPKLNPQENHKTINTGKPTLKKTTDVKKLPPNLVCYNIGQKELTGSLYTLLGHKNFAFNLINKNNTHIRSFLKDDYDKIKKFLIESKIKFYTFTPNEEKPYSIIIKKLCPSYEKDEILNYITELDLNINIINLNKFKNNNWLIQLSRSSNITELYNIKYILNCKVDFEKLNSPTPSQCKNCQRYTHVASNCYMQYRCVKCAQSHGPGKCQIPPLEENNKEYTYTDTETGQIMKRIGLPVRCVNCQTDGHTANSKKCPIRMELLQKIQYKKKTINSTTLQKDTQFITKSNHQIFMNNTNSMSFATAAKQNLKKVNSPSNEGQVFSEIDLECNRLFGSNLMSCLQIVGNFSQEYKNLKNDNDRASALFKLLVKMKFNSLQNE